MLCNNCKKEYNPKLETDWRFKVPNLCGGCARTRLKLVQTTPEYKAWDEGQQAKEQQMEVLRREQLGEGED